MKIFYPLSIAKAYKSGRNQGMVIFLFFPTHQSYWFFWLREVDLNHRPSGYELLSRGFYQSSFWCICLYFPLLCEGLEIYVVLSKCLWFHLQRGTSRAPEFIKQGTSWCPNLTNSCFESGSCGFECESLKRLFLIFSNLSGAPALLRALVLSHFAFFIRNKLAKSGLRPWGLHILLWK